MGREHPLFVTRGKSGLLRYISYPLICVLRDAFLSRGPFLCFPPLPSLPFPPASARGLCPSYFASFCFTAVSRKDRRETRGIRLSFHREKQTKLEEIAFAIVTRLLSPSFPSSLFLPIFASRFYVANSFSAGMKEKLRGHRETTATKTRKFLYKYISFGLTLSIYKILRYISVAKRYLSRAIHGCLSYMIQINFMEYTHFFKFHFVKYNYNALFIFCKLCFYPFLLVNYF